MSGSHSLFKKTVFPCNNEHANSNNVVSPPVDQFYSLPDIILRGLSSYFCSPPAVFSSHSYKNILLYYKLLLFELAQPYIHIHRISSHSCGLRGRRRTKLQLLNLYRALSHSTRLHSIRFDYTPFDSTRLIRLDVGAHLPKQSTYKKTIKTSSFIKVRAGDRLSITQSNKIQLESQQFKIVLFQPAYYWQCFFAGQFVSLG